MVYGKVSENSHADAEQSTVKKVCEDCGEEVNGKASFRCHKAQCLSVRAWSTDSDEFELFSRVSVAVKRS